jgi:choline kinase
MKAVILAAGMGTRLRPVTYGTPKALMEIGGRAVIEYPLRALQEAGISEVGVVVGHQSQRVGLTVQEFTSGITIIENDSYRGGNAISVLAARSFVADEPFVLCMADHVISAEITMSLLSEDSKADILCVDRRAYLPSQIGDATRVLTDLDGTILDIGKNLDFYNAVDTGVFRITAQVFEAIEQLMRRQGLAVSISDVVTHMGRQGRPFSTCDVSGMFWADVDTPEDYRSVETLLKGDRWKASTMASSPAI